MDYLRLCVVIESSSMEALQMYRINTPQIIFEVFEDEIIIVSFFDGSYFSVKSSAAAIWQAIHAGASTQNIIDQFAAAHPTDSGQVRESVAAFIAELAQLNLIVPADHAGDHSVAINLPATTAGFQEPVLETYNDMQDLLLLDPIHEVDEVGWPQKAPDAQAHRAA